MMKLKFKTLALLLLSSISLFTKAQTLPTYVPTNGLIGWWPFNGNAKDESGKGNDLSVNGAALSTDRNGLSNGAYYFDGNSSNLKANLSLRTSPGVTISCWGNISGFNNIQTLINLTSANQLAAFGINYSDNAKTVDAYATPNSLGILTIQRNKWNHYLITTDYATSTSKFYCNGILIGSSNSNIDTTIRTELNVGMHHSDAWGYGWYFNGKLDDIGIWNKALSENEIKLLYNPASILVQPKNVVTKVATNAMFIVKTADSGVTYQWQTNTGSGFTNMSNGGQFAGANNDTLLVNKIQLANNNQQFRCITKTGMDQDTSTIANIFIPNIPAYVSDSGLVGWWPFNGNAKDESGNGNHGTVNGATLTTDRYANSNKAYSFDGSNDFIALPKLNAIANQQKATLSFWGNLQNQGCVFSQWSFSNPSGPIGLNAKILNNGSVHCEILGGIGQSSNSGLFTNNTWNHIVIQFDGTKTNSNERFSVYVNGMFRGNFGLSSTPSVIGNQSDSAVFGAAVASPFWDYMKGQLDDIGIWNRALTESEIKLLYNPASILVQPKNVVTKVATNARFIIQTADSGVTYQWQTNTGSGFTNMSNGGQYTGANNDTLFVKNIQKSNNNQQFRCITKTGMDQDTSTIANIFIPNIPAYVSDSGLVGWWPFNGNAKDESGNGNHGTLAGTILPALSDDRRNAANSAYYFTGDNASISSNGSHIMLPDLLFNSWGQFTISSWVYEIQCYDDGETFINFGNEISFFRNPYTKSIGGMSSNANYEYRDNYSFINKWKFYLMTYDGTTMRFYIDGLLINSQNCSLSTLTAGNSAIGRHWWANGAGTSTRFNGKVDDIGVWNRALTQQEITDLFKPCPAAVQLQPVNAIAKINETARFIVKPSDKNVSYQWQRNTGNGFVNLSNGGQFSDVNKDTLKVSNVTRSNDQQLFRCVVVSSTCSDTSNSARLIVPNIPAYVPGSGLAAWWPFTGNALDSSGYGNHGQVKGATLTTDRNGNPNSAYEFNGSNNYINIANSELKKAINNVSQVTIVTWVNLPDLSLWGGGIFNHWQKGPVSNNVGLQFGYYGNKTMGVSSLNGIGVPTSPVKLNQNEWVMFTCIYDGTQSDPKNRYKVYRGDNILIPLDCSKPGYCDFPNITSPDANETYIGALTDGGSEAWMYFKGKIDDMGVWNRILSPEEITKLLNDCKPSIVQQPSNQTVKETEKAIFTLTSSDPNASYTWQGNNGFGFVNLFNAGPISGVNNDTLTISNSSLLYNNQLFRCIVKSGKCSDTSLSAVLNVNKPNSTSQYKASELIQLYPNPAHGSFYLKVHPVLIGQSFTITDIHGRAVFSGSIENDHTLVTPELQDPGIYILQTSGGFHYKFRFLTN